MAAAKTGLHDFDLWIEPEGSGYRARARCGGREESSGFQLRLFGPDLARLHEVDSQKARDLGSQLFRAAFSSEILALYRSCRKESPHGCFRLILHLPAGSEPARWPWELLWDDREGGGFLALSSSVVRWQESLQPASRKTFAPPLRLLVAIAQPRELPPLSSEEPAWIKRTLDSCGGRVEIEVLGSATFAEVERRLLGPVPYHLFHFLGHGLFRVEDGNGVLCFETEHGRTEPVDSLRLSATLRRCASLRLVVLNACEAALATANDPVSGLAQALVHLGVPRVVAMQSQIFHRAAVCFSGGFYGALAAGASIEAALTDARGKMNAAPQGRNWGLPVLITSVPDETLLAKPQPRWLLRLKLAAAVLALPIVCLVVYLLLWEPPFPPKPPPGNYLVDCSDWSEGQVQRLGLRYESNLSILERDLIVRGLKQGRWSLAVNRPGRPEIEVTEDGKLRTKKDDSTTNNLDQLPTCLALRPRKFHS